MTFHKHDDMTRPPALMTRADFVSYRDQIITASDQQFLRLDDFDPFTTLRPLYESFAKAASGQVPDRAALIAQWAETMDVRAWQDYARPTQGVRATISALFDHQAGAELWLPRDVYPFYWDKAASHSLHPRSFNALPQPDFTALDAASAQASLLITNPISPLGRYLNGDEVKALNDWLEVSPQRRVILDTVYAYQDGFAPSTCALYETGQCVVTHSLSKAWLERGVYGTVLLPPADIAALGNAFAQPADSDMARAYHALQRHQALPAIQHEAFQAAWAELTPRIRAIDAQFAPPESGYFAVIEGHHADILAMHNTLVLPASAFGSQRPDLSVVSCLQHVRP